jgi:hypothetical protein
MNFSGDGAQVLGGASIDFGYRIRMACSGQRLFVAGSFFGDFNVGGSGPSLTGLGFEDTALVALNVSDGSLVPGFAGDGILHFGGSNVDAPQGLVVAGDLLLLSGWSASLNASIIGTDNTFSSTGESDAFVYALSSASGKVLNHFGGDGLLQMGGPGFEAASVPMAIGPGRLHIGGFSSNGDSVFSTNYALDGIGPVYPETRGYLLDFDAVTGTPRRLAATGPAGPQGPTGPAGPEGPTGPTGPAGSNGTNGAATSGTLVYVRQGQSPPANTTLLGTMKQKFKKPDGKTLKATVDVYEQN